MDWTSEQIREILAWMVQGVTILCSIINLAQIKGTLTPNIGTQRLKADTYLEYRYDKDGTL